MDSNVEKISVIIPITSAELLWKDLLQDLMPLTAQAEILLVGSEPPDPDLLRRSTERIIANVKYVRSRLGRGAQLNRGAKEATGDYFWFLHADTKVPRPAIFALEKQLEQKPFALHFFDLQFLNDGPRLMGLSSIGANIRSKYFGMPYGDQGFAMSRATFAKLGGFSDEEESGEDIRMVWEAKRKNVPLNRVPACIFTSARRYDQFGWSKVTTERWGRTGQIFLEEYSKLVKQRLIESIKSN